MKNILIAIAVSVASVGFAQTTNAYRYAGGTSELPRMVVVNFRPATGDSISWNGQSESSAMWAGRLADKLTERLTQMRKFLMIDRKFDAEIQDEIRRLSDKNAAKGDMIRLGQRLGTDYMIVGDIRFFPVRPAGVNPITGQAMAVAPQRFAEISFRVILAPTGQILHADSVALGSAEFPASDMASFVSMTVDCATEHLVASVMSALFPGESRPKTPPVVDMREPNPAPPPAVDTTIRGTGNGGIVTPF